MDYTDRAGGMRIARTMARNGEHRNWHGVEARMTEMGFVRAELWFCSFALRGEIDGLCLQHFKKIPHA
jgi:hypothetical protein